MATGSWEDFEVRMRQRAADVDQLVLEKTQALALTGVRVAVLETPVDEGRLRGNWQVTVDEPAEGFLTTTDKNGGTTIGKAARAIMSAAAYAKIWLHNGLHYAAHINNGSERIRAFNMTGKAVIAMRSVGARVRRVRRETA